MTSTAALSAAAPTPLEMLGGLPQAGGSRTIEETGKQFESLFLSLLLKEMRQTVGEEGFFPGDSGDVQGGLFDFFLGKHLADSGGVGLADTLKRSLTPIANAPGSPRADTSSIRTS